MAVPNNHNPQEVFQISSDPSSAAAPEAMPDLERILAELSSFTGSNQTPSAVPSNPSIPNSHAVAPSSAPAATAVPIRRQEVAQPPPARTNLIDPATIFEWPQALRCVNKMAASNPKFGPAIKTMMADQERNVQDWEQQRTKKVKDQGERVEKIKELNKVLKSVGAEPQSEPTEAENKTELNRYDLGVYKASQQMAKVHALELKRLGVPFFGVDPKLIIANDIQQAVAARNPLSQATITEAELLDLQRKMVQYLEDMYKD